MDLIIRGASVNNLKNVTVEIPRNKLTVISGVSGSGKTSLAYDTLYAEALREYIETLSVYSRIDLPHLDAPNVDEISGLSPCISINQKPLSQNPRSTVGTITELYTYLRVLYSRLGGAGLNAGDFSFNNQSGACPTCTGLGVSIAPDLEKLLDIRKSLNEGAILHRTWAVGSRNYNIIKTANFFDMDKPLRDFSPEEMDLLLYSETKKILNQDPGFIQGWVYEGVISRLIRRQRDSRGQKGNSYDSKFFSLDICKECKGARINLRARSVQIEGKSIVQLSEMELTELLNHISNLKGPVVDTLKPYLSKMCSNLISVGLGYLHLNRPVTTLSSGENQRVKLARQLGNSLSELIYIFDEPTTGLHPKDVEVINNILRKITNKPNTVIAIEHDKTVMLSADNLIDMGIKSGSKGGRIVASGTPEEIITSNSLIGKYLKNIRRIQNQKSPRIFSDYLSVENVNIHNLKNLSTRIPINSLTCITGVSGSGKSSLFSAFKKKYPEILVVDQLPPGKTNRSNPATYTKLFDDVRNIYADISGMDKGFFSFNSQGACECCLGTGYIAIDFSFWGEIKQICKQCQGKRYKEDILSIKYNGRSISDVLEMTVADACSFFVESDKIMSTLKLLSDVGLGYLTLGQPLNTLSGGEAQRIKLVSRLNKKGEFYFLDEPTRGLHFLDADRMLQLMKNLVNVGNTVVLIEHNLDVIKNSDWIIDLGPGSGKNGGEIVFEGRPKDIIEDKYSITGKYLV